MSVIISRVSVEHYECGLGITMPSPRLSWRFDGSAKDWVQKGYTIKVTRHGKTETYEQESSESVLVPWPSDPLVSQEKVKVQVQAKGNNGSTGWASLDVEAGLLEKSDWLGKLVSAEKQTANGPKRPFLVRKAFKLDSTPESCRLYITAHGLHEATINGKPVGNEHFAPGWSSYKHHLHYSIFDITSLLVSGDNEISAWVGEGWFAGRMGFFDGVRDMYGDRLGLLAQLEVDGKCVAATDTTWSWSYGGLLTSEIYDGEIFDSNMTARDWKPVEDIGMPSGHLFRNQAPPVREIERITAKEIIKTPSGKTIVDFGQNFAGWVEFKKDPPKYGILTLRHAEVLEHGELGTRPLRFAKATDIIILGGDMTGWRPKFTFHGFRYVEVSGWTDVSLESMVGVVLASDMERTGWFECSHKLLNRLHRNVYYSTRSNTISVPTDCPQRDERLGWTGDIQVFTPTLGYLFDSSGFLSNWLKDLAVDQAAANGIVPLVLPSIPLDGLFMSQAIWGDCAVLTPWDMYHITSDIEILKAQYESLTTWLDKGVRRDPETRLWPKGEFQFADWLAPAADPEAAADGPTDNVMVADAYLVHTTRVAACICHRIGEEKKAKQYEEDAAKLLGHFHDTYVTPNSRMVSDTQTALALVLRFDLFNPAVKDQKQILGKRIGDLVTKDLWLVSTGFAGTPMSVLPDSSLSPILIIS